MAVVAHPEDRAQPFRFSGAGDYVEAYCSLWPKAVATARSVLHSQPLAEDVAQDVFLDLWARPQKFSAERGSLATYVCLLAKSRALDRARSDAARRRAGDRLTDAYSPTEAVAPAADAKVTSEAGTLAAAIRDLPEGQSEALLLAYGKDLTAREIAALKGVPIGTAKSRVRLGLNKLRVAFNRDPPMRDTAAHA